MAARALGARHGGDGRLIVLAGEPGIGKTRLAAELAGEVHRAGVRCCMLRAPRPRRRS